MSYSAFHIFNPGIMHRHNKLTGTIIIIAFILQSCIYEFHLKAGNYENFLVIYGMVTTENGPHEITILKTSKYRNDADSVGFANVSISDDKGNSIPLTEVSMVDIILPKRLQDKLVQSINYILNYRKGNNTNQIMLNCLMFRVFLS